MDIESSARCKICVTPVYHCFSRGRSSKVRGKFLLVDIRVIFAHKSKKKQQVLFFPDICGRVSSLISPEFCLFHSCKQQRKGDSMLDQRTKNHFVRLMKVCPKIKLVYQQVTIETSSGIERILTQLSFLFETAACLGQDIRMDDESMPYLTLSQMCQAQQHNNLLKVVPVVLGL